MNNLFLSKATAALTPYTPGEQPRAGAFLKLNTNECPYPPSPNVKEVLQGFDSGDLRLYPDPDAGDFTAELAALYGLRPEQVLACGGSDEALGFAFLAFSDRGDRVYFPDITYGFYQVYADLFGLEAVKLPLREDFTVAEDAYFDRDGTIYIANPNAPTGIALAPAQVETILQRNPGQVVVVDEAYVDFAPGNSCVPLLAEYENLLVTQTFSKSRSLAGMRLGAAFGSPALIEGLRRIKYSFNPYNLDRVSMAVGIAALRDQAYFQAVVQKVIATRGRVSARLQALGFAVLPSSSNFLFAAHPALAGEVLYHRLRESGILVRYFDKPRINGYVRITIGSDSGMDQFLKAAERLT